MSATRRFASDPHSILRTTCGFALFLLLAPLLSACSGGGGGVGGSGGVGGGGGVGGAGVEGGGGGVAVEGAVGGVGAGGDRLEGTTILAARRKNVDGLVRFEGCVVDETFLSSEDVPIRALDIDGRLLANARSDRRGLFALRVPVGIEMAVAVDRDGGDVLKVRGLDRDSTVPLCLVARPDEGEDDDDRRTR